MTAFVEKLAFLLRVGHESFPYSPVSEGISDGSYLQHFGVSMAGCAYSLEYSAKFE